MKTRSASFAHPGKFIVNFQRYTHSWLLLLGIMLTSVFLNSCKQKQADPQQPPVVKVSTVSQSAVVGGSVVLDGSASSSPTNQALTYRWTIKSKPDQSNATLSNPTSITATLTPDKPGTYVLILTVTDSNNVYSSVEVVITVAIPGRPPVASAGTSSTVSTGRKVTLDGSKSSDPDGDKLVYKWEFKTKPTGSASTINNADKAVAEFTPDVLGTYVLTLSVSDGNWPTVTSEVTVTVAVPVNREITSSWTAADGTGGGNDYTPRNHFFTFDVAANSQPVSLSLTSSDINVGFYVYNPGGQVIDSYGSGFGRSQTEDMIVNAGKYTVMVCSAKRYDIGAYTLKGRGISSEFTLSPALRVKATDVSFGMEGGGGTEYTARNHYYTFEVTADNTYTDINIQSAQIPLWMNLFGPSGAQIDYTYSGTPRYLVPKLNKGTYGLWLGSGGRDNIGNYTLDIFGQVQNLKQYVFDSSILTDDYRGKNAPTTYTLTVTDDNTYLDVSLRSPDIGGYLLLYNPSGVQIDYTYAGNYRYFTQKVNKGKYKILVYPADNASGIGKYTLSVYGKFMSLSKQ